MLPAIKWRERNRDSLPSSVQLFVASLRSICREVIGLSYSVARSQFSRVIPLAFFPSRFYVGNTGNTQLCKFTLDQKKMDLATTVFFNLFQVAEHYNSRHPNLQITSSLTRNYSKSSSRRHLWHHLTAPRLGIPGLQSVSRI